MISPGQHSLSNQCHPLWSSLLHNYGVCSVITPHYLTHFVKCTGQNWASAACNIIKSATFSCHFELLEKKKSNGNNLVSRDSVEWYSFCSYDRNSCTVKADWVRVSSWWRSHSHPAPFHFAAYCCSTFSYRHYKMSVYSQQCWFTVCPCGTYS